MIAQTSRYSLCTRGALVLFAAMTTAFAAPILPASAGVGSVKVNRGEEKANEDGANVKNDSSAKGTRARISPKKSPQGLDGTLADVESVVTCNYRFKGKVTGIDSTDSVIFHKDSVATVTARGGKVKVGEDSMITVIAEKGGPAVTVTLPGGTTATVAGGSTTTFNT